MAQDAAPPAGRAGRAPAPPNPLGQPLIDSHWHVKEDSFIRMPLRPEDDNQGEIEHGTGEMGFFSPHSWWPLFLGIGAASAALGLAIGWWLFLIGMLWTVFATIGFVFEYYRGHFAH